MGEVIEFYYPAPRVLTKIPAVEEPIEEAPAEQMAAGDLLRGVLSQEDTIRDVLVITRDPSGHCALLSNLDGVADCVLLIEQTKLRILNAQPENPQPRGTA